MGQVTISIVALPGAVLPVYQTEEAAGMDLCANITEALILHPGKRSIIPTGIKVALPKGHQMEIRGRSGLAAKHGIGLVNGVGTIDADYRGEIGVILINHGEEDFIIHPGDRIAQAIVTTYERVTWEPVKELAETTRGEGGFGSTTKNHG